MIFLKLEILNKLCSHVCEVSSQKDWLVKMFLGNSQNLNKFFGQLL